MKLKRPPKDVDYKNTNGKEVNKPGTYVCFVEEIRKPFQAKQTGLYWLFVTLREVPPSVGDEEPKEGGIINLVMSWDNAAWDFTSDYQGKGRWNQFLSAFNWLDNVESVETDDLIGQPLKVDVEMFNNRASVRKCWPVTAPEAADVADYRQCFTK